MHPPSMGNRNARSHVRHIARLYRRRVLLVAQDVELALTVAGRGVVLQTGQVVLAGTAEQLRGADEVAAAYLGG
jgi:ABC-type branched-subunit amino acid transport system ATPase component